MPGPKLSCVCLLLIAAEPVWAYAGGIGPEVVGSLALLWWVLSAIGAMALWPIYSFIRWVRGVKADPEAAAETGAVSAPEDGGDRPANS